MFDIYTNTWKKLKTCGTLPTERYGHSLNLYRKFIKID